MKKVILTNENIEEIIRLYTDENYGTHKLGELFHIGHRKISELLVDNNIPIKKKGAQVIHGKTNEIIKTKAVVYKSDISKLIAVCKKTGIIFEDVNNLSGVLTTHIMKNYENVTPPSNYYQRKKYEESIGQKWFEEYFDIQEVEKDEYRNCKLCEWKTKDLYNRTGCFENHLTDDHNISINEYLDKFPEDEKFHPTIIREKLKQIEFSNEDNFVICLECNKKFRKISDSHLKTHNLTISEYKIKHNKINLISNELKGRVTEQYYNTLYHHEHSFTSKAQVEINELIKSFGLETKLNDKKSLKGTEIDILIPTLGIGIEYNGLYYHREGMGKDMNFHLNKTILANENNIKLIQIFEDEWIHNKDLVKSKITHILGFDKSNIIGARKCEIKKITKDMKCVFLEKNHIQGNDISNIHIGAFYNEKLVAVMCFLDKRPMNSKKEFTPNEYELTRFAIINNHRISGISNRLLKFFIEEYKPKNIISFADRRWTLDKNKNLYTNLGFKLVKILKPDYKYFNFKISRNKRLHKFSFGKNKLKVKYPELDYTKTEWELVSSLGFDRVWDCGLFKYELKLNNEL